jgi:hypothetical protein
MNTRELEKLANKLSYNDFLAIATFVLENKLCEFEEKIEGRRGQDENIDEDVDFLWETIQDTLDKLSDIRLLTIVDC